MATGGLSELAGKALAAHGIGAGSAPKAPELWEQFTGCAQTERITMDIENRFFAGYEPEQLDWSRPVHALLLDFKGDGMQIGMLLERLEVRGEQYVCIAAGNNGFNGGWAFSAVNDFEHPAEQRRLDPSWRNVRVWTRVGFVCSVTEAGAPALVQRDSFNPAARHLGAVPVSASFRFASVFLTGGLMPHTLNATAIADGGPAGLVLAKHLELGATLAAVGHGLDVLIACGTPEQSLVAGFEAAVFPNQDRLLEISGMRKSPESVCRSSSSSTGALLVSASHWGPSTAGAWFDAVGLPETPGAPDVAASAGRTFRQSSAEIVHSLDVGKLPGMSGAAYRAPGDAAAAGPLAAVFVDEVADPVEIFTILSHLREQQISFMLVSHSSEPGSASERCVTTETVFGNPMYALRECVCIVPTVPADLVPADVKFDSFFVAGGQCPYHMQRDAAVTAIMDGASLAAPVCHGPEAMHGSKWMSPGGTESRRFTAYTGCWVSFRDVLSRFEKKKPGEIVQDGPLFSGNAPQSTKALMTEACAALLRLRAGGKL